MAQLDEQQFKLSHARFGKSRYEQGVLKVHLQTRVEGKDYLSLMCWNAEKNHFSWHFYNHKMDRVFQSMELRTRQEAFMKIAPSQSLAEIQDMKSVWERFLDLMKQALKQPVVVQETPKAPSKKTRHAKTDAIEDAQHDLNVSEVCHPIHNYFDELNALYFEGKVEVPIRWMRSTFKKHSSKITFGLYDRNKHEIRLNVRLNQDWVPDYFVKMVLHHEMLHAVMPPIKMNGKYLVHTREFRQRERLFQQYREAILWQRANLKLLMKSQN